MFSLRRDTIVSTTENKEIHEGYTRVPGTNVFVRNRRENGARFSDLIRITEEVLNPRVTCGFSRDTDERHAPAGMSEPSMPKKDVDTQGVIG